MDEEATSKKMKKSRRGGGGGGRITKKKKEMHRDKRFFETIRQRIFLKTFPFGPVYFYFYSGVSYNCNLLTLQISTECQHSVNIFQ